MNTPPPNEPPPPLILASTSPARRALLAKLNLPFQTCAPDIDETPRPGEAAADLVLRLAIEKAQAARRHFRRGIAIGCDQVCVIAGKVHGKPGNFDNAARQLRLASGKTARFLTGLCVFDIESGARQATVEPFEVAFKTISEQQITHYLRAEQPWHCAGAFKSEGLGIALVNKFHGNDPNALIGLPLIQLIAMLERQHIAVPPPPGANP